MRPWIVLAIVAVVCGAAALVTRDERATNRQRTEITERLSAFHTEITEFRVAPSRGSFDSTDLPSRSLFRGGPSTAEVARVVSPLPATVLALMAPLAPPAPMAPVAPEGTEAPYAPHAPHAPYALYAPLVPTAPFALYAPYAPVVPMPSAPIALQRKLSDPAFVKKLYVTYAALQLADVASTTAALRSGNGREANPLVRGYAHSPAAMIGVKAAITVGTILALERVREKRPVAVTVTLIALNATLAAVVVNNASVAAGASSR